MTALGCPHLHITVDLRISVMDGRFAAALLVRNRQHIRDSPFRNCLTALATTALAALALKQHSLEQYVVSRLFFGLNSLWHAAHSVSLPLGNSRAALDWHFVEHHF
jgi:hypothetical protein